VRAVLCTTLALVALLSLTAAQATGAKPHRDTGCTWGASSVRAHIVDGRILVSPPVTTGCVPN
jgi:hypothetical protein